MVEIHLQLYSILREKLPPESNGKVDIHLSEGAVLADLLEELGITRRVVISVNGDHESDMSRRLQEGDQVKIFSSVSGGSYQSKAKIYIKGENNA
jgi:thiamine biosynthesis protein ThiS